MARIDLAVRCKYDVSLYDVEVPDDIAKVLVDAPFVQEGTEAFEWLSDNIRESDASDWEYDIWLADYVEEKGGEK